MYCRRCDKDDVGSFHRCFTIYSKNPIKPLLEKPDIKNRISYRLLKRIRKELGIIPRPLNKNEPVILRSLRTGHHQKSQGAFSWYAENTVFGIGSCETMLNCLRAKKLSWFNNHGDIEIIIEEE